MSPVQENTILKDRPWYERYQTISYRLTTRSGNQENFADMVRRCNAVGVRIYPDVIINHMTGRNDPTIGVGGSIANPNLGIYPTVPFDGSHFNHPVCGIDDWEDPIQVRNCELVSLRDLNQTIPHVREKIINLLNQLIDLGVAGFRIDAAKHMWPADLKFIYDNLKPLNSAHGFEKDATPFIFQEVIDLAPGAERLEHGISRDEYIPLVSERGTSS